MKMGMGELGFKNLVFKRKFRFTFELENICSKKTKPEKVPRHFVKVASRPSLSIEETEINFLNAKTWIPGKASWDTMTVTYIDVAHKEMQPLYNWLASVYNFNDSVHLNQGSSKQDYNARGILKLWDGCGKLIETWKMEDVWPTAINFGELDYSSSDEVTIELTLRYSDVHYKSNCPKYKIEPCKCTGCPTEENESNNENESESEG